MRQSSEYFLHFKERRKKLLNIVKARYATISKGVILIAAGFENERYGFRQSSSFYYLTGIDEPAMIVCIFFDGREIAYVPNFGNEREKWVKMALTQESDPTFFGFDEIRFLSQQVKGYSYSPFFQQSHYDLFLRDLENFVDNQTPVFTIFDDFELRKLFESLQGSLPLLKRACHDASSLVHEQRRIKDDYELTALQTAINITHQAQLSAARSIKPGLFEYQVQAELEYEFTFRGAQRTAFPSIVATGKNTTVLHYVNRNEKIKEGDLVVVDIGAEYGLYAADLTRTYPASGKFTQRQREIYDLVLETQEYIASCAKPGMFLRNVAAKERSLHYLTVKFLEERGYAKYFPHGIGHYLGLEVHDVGDYATPLQQGDVFTIEPGIYIPEEGIGVRIEDDYLMLAHGVECLSKDLPKKSQEIEQLMQNMRSLKRQESGFIERGIE